MKNLLLILLLVSTFACNKNDDTNVEDLNAKNEMELKLDTGLNYKEVLTELPLVLGNPNIYTTTSHLELYPNPGTSLLNLNTSENITNIWFVPARAEKIYQNVDFGSIYNSNSYDETTISSVSVKNISGQNASNIQLNTENLDPGYYRVFVKINGSLFWENYYKLDPNSNIEQQKENIINFWN